MRNMMRSTLIGLIYLVSLTPFLISNHGFFYKSRPYFFVIIFFIVIFDLIRNFKTYNSKIFLPSKNIIPLILLLISEIASLLYTQNISVSIQLLIANLFIISVLLIYAPIMKEKELYYFFIEIISINTFLFIVSIILLLVDYRMATVTRFGFYTFTGIFYSKQIGIVGLMTALSVDIVKKHSAPYSKLRYLLNTIYIFSILFILLSFSRAAFLSLLLYWGILILYKKVNAKLTVYYLILLAVLITLFIFKPLNTIIKYTVTDRQFFINYAFHIYKKYFFIGNGYGCGKFLTRLPEAAQYIRHDLMGKQFHNTYLEIYFDTGFPGLFFFLWMIFLSLKRLFKQKNILFSSVLISLLFINFFTSSLAYPSSLSYLFTYFFIIYGLVGKGSFS